MSKMLYIDDDPDALELYADILAPKVNVVPCMNPEECLVLAEQEDFDAFLLDIYLPGTNGFEIYEAIRRIPKNRTTPVFFISAENTVANRLKAFGLGSEDFISRSMEPDEVVLRITKRLEKTSHTGLEKLSYGDIQIDQENLQVKTGEGLVELTQTEYRLLLLLVRESLRQPGKVFEREEVIQFVWPVDPESVFPRTLATHLTNLRKKINSKNVTFKSVRQTGIKLILK